jgi:primosomal protein N' (replication factor Y) (superfamily II helicase)
MTALHRYDILLPLPQNVLYTYTSDQELELGTIVDVPFGKRLLTGVIWEETDPSYQPNFQIKPIAHVWGLPAISLASRKLIDWAAQYYMSFRGNCLKMLLSGLPDKKYTPRKKYGYFTPPQDCPRSFPLTSDQLDVTNQIQLAIQSNIFKAFLLDGVTGSGKTEVYYEALLDAIRENKQVLILLPEITLTQQWLQRFQQRFGVLPARWYSSLKQTERRHTWQQIIKGHASVVVGARSALFLPFNHLGLIVVDEEHDSSYKQEEGMHYHARDLAVVRARFESCPLVLASATPSIESHHNVAEGKYTLLTLSHRFGTAGNPKAHLIDLRQKSEGVGHGEYVSNTLISALNTTIERKEQAIIFLNRRGFAPLTLCTECGYKLQCPDCSAHLVYHRLSHERTILQCHHCGLTTPPPTRCPECAAEESLRQWGVGIDRLTDEIRHKCPKARILTVSSDHITHQNHLDELYEALNHHKIDIVIGTQLMAKGHDFPNVTLVGIVDADAGLMTQDIRAAETTYQLLHQVAGRCGRGEKPGNVYIQTFAPHHPVIQALKTFDRDTFLSLELHNRQIGQLPPFSRQASLIITGDTDEQVKQIGAYMYQKIPSSKEILIFGPAPAPLIRLRGKYRYRFLAQAPRSTLLQPFLHQWLDTLNLPRSIKLTIDIDPISFF